MTFFDPRSTWREPPWMAGERGPDLSPELRWFPVVTFLQMTVHLAFATRTPVGFGHNYAPEDYIDGWVAVSDPPGLTTGEVARLKEEFSGGARRPGPAAG